jgi:MFS family permease
MSTPRDIFLRITGTYKGLPPPIYALFLARVVTALGAFVFPFLTLTLTARLKLSEAEAGATLTLVLLCSVVGSLLGGWLSDHRPKRQVLFGGQLLAGAATLAAGFVHDSPRLIPLLLVAMVGFGVVSPALSSLVAEVTPRARRRDAYSLGHLGANVGFSVGPLLAGFLFHSHPQWLFWGDGLTTLLAAVVVQVGTRGATPHAQGEEREGAQGNAAPTAPREAASDPEASVQGSVWSILRARPQLIAYSALSILLAMSYEQVNFTLPVTLNELFGEEGAGRFGAVMSANGACVLILTPLITAFVSAGDHLTGLKRAGLCYGVGFGTFALLAPAAPLDALTGGLTTWGLLLLSTVIWTAGEIFSVNHGSAFVAQESPASHRGRVSGALSLAAGLMRALSPTLSGALLPLIGAGGVWGLVLLMGLAAGAGFEWTRRRWPSAAPPLERAPTAPLTAS